MKWIQFFALIALLRILIMVKIKSLNLNTYWIPNIVWPVRSYIESQLPGFFLKTASSEFPYSHIKFHSTHSLKTKVNRPIITFQPNWNWRGEVLCLKHCGHLRAAQISRPGLKMIQEIYNYFPVRPDVKAQHHWPSPHLALLIKLWRTHLTKETLMDNPWNVADKWGTSQTLVDTSGTGLANILSSMKKSAVTYSDVGYKGTQLKMTLTLKGNQTVIFKPRRSKNTEVFNGDVYGGPDRHQGEIAAFHLGLVLNMTMVPLVVGRRVSLRKEILPVASKSLSKTVFIRGMSTCLYGVCYYCKSESAVCDEKGFLDGATILWLPKHMRLTHFPHPWARTYDVSKLAKWETNKDFCQLLNATLEAEGKLPLLLSLIDLSIFDFLIQNGDRHHYSVVSSDQQGTVVFLDNGKSFGDPLVDHLDILAPLLQCCRIRRRTLDRLELLLGGGLSRAMDDLMKTDALYPVLSPPHLKAMDRRLSLVLAAIHACRHSVGDAIFF